MILEWVQTDGGPLILAPAELVAHWHGDDYIEDSSLTDYDRAISVDDYLGMLSLGPGQCVVVNDEPMATSFISHDDSVILLRVICVVDIDQAVKSIRSAPNSIWEETSNQIQVAEFGLVLFGATMVGSDLVDYGDDSWISIPIAPGCYQFDTADFTPDDSTRLILHRLRRINA